METEFTRLIGVENPIVCGPMASGITTPALVAAVSNAGGFGGLGAHMMPPDRLRDAIEQIKQLTDRPFAVNFLVAPFGESGDAEAVTRFLDRFRDEMGIEPASGPPAAPPWMLPAQLQVLEEMQVRVWSFALGLDQELIDRGHAAGARVIGTATTVNEAIALEAAGCDAVVAQGAEAGGHRSTFEIGADRQGALVGTMALVPQVVDAVKVPVIAAGGIMDGRGVVAALDLGASAAQLGTRFLLSDESGASPAYRERLLASSEDDTVVTDVLTGRPTRTVRNELIDRWIEEGPLPHGWMVQAMAALDIYGAAMGSDDADHFMLQAGQGLRMADDVRPAADIVRDLVAEASAILSTRE